jgi:hypothetical protein
MLGSGTVDLAIGLVFVFGVTAALSSAVTELIARFLGLRGAYLLSGLSELVDSGNQILDLTQVKTDYTDMRAMIQARMQTPQAPSTDGARVAPGTTAQGQAPTATGHAQDETTPGNGTNQAQASQASSTAQAQAPQASSTAPAQAPPATAALLGGPILGSQGMAGQISERNLRLTPTKPNYPAKLTAPAARRNRWGMWRDRRSLPSYIPARSFSDAVIDLVVPDTADQTTMDTIHRSVNALPDVWPLKPSLLALLKDAGDDVVRFRGAVEHWYEDHMDRVSGWYKRYVARITLLVGAVLVVAFNVNTLTIGRTLFSDSTVNSAVSTVAANTTNCSRDEQSCLSDLQARLSAASTAGLPIGWGTVRDCVPPDTQCNWLDERGIFSRHGSSAWELLLVLAGFLVSMIAMVPGAQFWFGLLTKVGSFRATGPRPQPPASVL